MATSLIHGLHGVPAVGRVVRDVHACDLSGRPIDLRTRRGPAVLLRLHDDGCRACRTWVRRELADRESEIERWGGQIVMAPPVPDADREASPAWLAVLDEWGEVFHAWAIGPTHDVPGIEAILDWVRFVAVQCPECEAPEGPWRR